VEKLLVVFIMAFGKRLLCTYPLFIIIQAPFVQYLDSFQLGSQANALAPDSDQWKKGAS